MTHYVIFVDLKKKSYYLLTNEGKFIIIIRLYLAYGQYGGIAQLARALGSYPKGRWFKSYFRYHMARWSNG